MASREQIQSITGIVGSLEHGKPRLLFRGSRVASGREPRNQGSVSRYSHGNSRETSRLSRLRSLSRGPVPEASRTSDRKLWRRIPAEIRKTPEGGKIALGEKKLFFEQRLYAEGNRGPCFCPIGSANSTTAGPHQWGFRGG